jgi:hypothetical protein
VEFQAAFERVGDFEQQAQFVDDTAIRLAAILFKNGNRRKPAATGGTWLISIHNSD